MQNKPGTKECLPTVPFLNGGDSQLLGSEVLIKVTLGEVGGGVGIARILGGEGGCRALCSGFGSWLLERGHLVGCTCMTLQVSSNSSEI